MINISGKLLDSVEIKTNYNLDPVESSILDILSSSDEAYSYKSIDQLKFELHLRSGIVSSAKELYESNVQFSIFRKTKCNTDFWDRQDNGGFTLKDGVNPYNAIKDIFTSSSKYATECATAIVIIYYKALVNSLSETIFNELYPQIQLMNWQHLNRNLAVATFRKANDYLPGDCRYFKNPDVNPIAPEWQGENVIDLGNGVYFGHGIGIKSGDKIIKILNNRRKYGATESAYLTDTVTRQNYKFLEKASSLQP